MKPTLSLTAVLTAALLIGAQAQAQTYAVTGANGGTVTGQRDCQRGGGTATCATSSIATGPGGLQSARSRTRVSTAAGSLTTIDATGPYGRSTSRTRQVSR